MAAYRFQPANAAILAAIVSAGYSASGLTATSLETDGRTSTSVSENGNVFDVVTSTTRGQNAFNTFNAFRVASGDTVNLHLPESTLRLINLIHGSKSEIYGVVNSIKDGRIGGHVVFANPHGMVVGEGGVLNVGSLMMVAPSSDFMDRLLDGFADGSIVEGSFDASAFDALLAGEAPLNPDGTIQMEGRINAVSDINLRAVDISVAGQLHAATEQAQQALFQATVNVDGLQASDYATVDGGDIVIGASRSIDIQQNAQLVAATSAEGNGGDITLEANAAEEVFFGVAESEASVSVAGHVEGRDITFRASSLARVGLDMPEVDSLEDLADLFAEGADHIAQLDAEAAGDLLLGGALEIWGSGAFVVADATVDVTPEATLVANRDVTLEASAQREIDLPGRWSGLQELGLALSAASVSGETRVQVHQGAGVQAGGNLTVAARSDNTITNLSKPMPETGLQDEAQAAIAVTTLKTGTRALVDTGADVNVSGDVVLDARTSNSLTTQSTVEVDQEGGVAGISFALALADTTTEAVLGADLLSVGNVSLIAETVATENVTQASGDIGEPEPVDQNNGSISGAATSLVMDLAGEKGEALLGNLALIGELMSLVEGEASGGEGEGGDAEITTGMGERFKLAGALAVADTAQASRAEVLAGTEIQAAGDVAVLARVEGLGVRNSATSSVSAQTSDGSTDVTSSIAINYASHRHDAAALVGDGAVVGAARVGLGSDVVLPLNIADAEEWVQDGGDAFTSFNRWTAFADILDWLHDSRSLVDELPDTIFTSTANSTGDAEFAGLAGSVNYFNVDQNSLAWIGDGATVVARGADAAWETMLGQERAWQWQSPVSVTSRARAASINVGGNFGWLKLFGTEGAGDGSAAALGGAFLWNQYDSSTIAGIGEGTSVTAEALDVQSEAFHQFIALAPTAGNADGIAGNGAFAISRVNADTSATVSNTALVTANRLSVGADEALAVWTAVGAVAMSDNVGVGASIAVNDLHTTTHAGVGDNARYDPFDNAETPVQNAAPGVLAVNTLEIDALTDGQAGTFAVAGAAVGVGGLGEVPGFIDGATGELDSNVQGISDMVSGLGGDIPLLGTALEELTKLQNEAGSPVESAPEGDDQSSGPNVNLAATGSVGINLSGQETRAYVEGVTVRAREEDVVDSRVHAVNETLMLATAGGGSLVKGGGSGSSGSFSAAVAGAAAINVLQNTTEAAVQDSLLEDAGNVRVLAVSAGDQVAAGLGVAVEASGGGSSAYTAAVAGSGSVNWTANDTVAVVESSDITGSGALAVTAYDRTRVATGGGSLFAGGRAGIGTSLSLTNTNNSTRALLLGGAMSGLSDITVQALALNRIIGGGAVAGLSWASNSVTLAGALVFNRIGNTLEAAVRRDGDGQASDIDVNGDLIVAASDNASSTELDALLTGAGDADVDFFATGEDLGEEFARVAGSSSAILGVAGTVQAGRSNNVGLALAFNGIDNHYLAEIEAASINAGGDVSVNASDSAAVLGLAVGGGVSAGKFSGMGSVTGNVISSTTEARVAGDRVVDAGGVPVSGDAAQISARNLDVQAISSGAILSFAGSVAFATKAAVGAAVTFNHTGGLGDDGEVDAALAAQTTAYVEDADVSLTEDLNIQAARQAQVLSAAGSGAFTTGLVALGGSLNVTTLVDRASATLDASTVNARHLNLAVGSDALADGLIIGAAGNVNLSTKAAVGGAFAINTISTEREALLSDSYVELDGAATVASGYNGSIFSTAVGGGAAGKVAAGASMVVSTIGGHSHAGISGGSLRADSLLVDASGDTIQTNTLSGNIQGAGVFAMGVASSSNTIVTARTASIENGVIVVAGDAQVLAGSNQAVRTAAASGGGAGKVAVNGTLTTNTIAGDELARIHGGTLTAGSLSVRADMGERSIDSLAGAVSGAGVAAVGAAAAINTVSGDRRAEIEDGEFLIGGSLSLRAGGDVRIFAVAANGGGSGTAAVGGSASTNTILGEDSASLKGATVTADSLSLRSEAGSSHIASLAGNAAGAGTAAVGGATTINTLVNRRKALIESAQMNVSGQIDVISQLSGRVDSVAVAGGASGSAAVGGTVTTNVIQSSVEAGIRASGSSLDTQDTRIAATDSSSITSSASSGQGAGVAGVGVSSAANNIGNRVDAYLLGNDGTTFRARNVEVNALSDATIFTAAAGIAGAVKAGVAGSSAVNVVTSRTRAQVGHDDQSLTDADVFARNNVGVTAESRDLVTTLGGNLGFGLLVGGSASMVVNYMGSSTEALIHGAGTRVTALGEGEGLWVNSGQLGADDSEPGPGDDALAVQGMLSSDAAEADLEFNPLADLRESREQVKGVAVRSTSIQQVGTVSATTSVAVNPKGSGAFAGLGTVNVLTGSTLARVSGASINPDNDGAHADQALSIGASSHARSVDYVVSAGAALGGAAGNLDTSVIARSTEAKLVNADVTTRGAANVFAHSTQQGTAVALSTAGGLIAAAGTLGVVALTGDTIAGIDDSHVTAGSVAVEAISERVVNLHAGGVAVAGGALAGAASLGLILGTTEAYIRGSDQDASTVTSDGNVSVEAHTSSRIFNNVAVGSVGVAGFAGSAAINVIRNSTAADVSGTRLGSEDAGVSSLRIDAGESVQVNNVVGAAAGAGQGPAPGGSANVMVVQGSVESSLRDSEVHANGDVEVRAERDLRIEQITVAGSLSTIDAWGGSLGLLVLGSGSTSYDGINAVSELDRGETGALSQFDVAGSSDKLGWTVQEYEDPLTGEIIERDLFDGGEESLLSGEGIQSLEDSASYSGTEAFSNGAAHETTAYIDSSTVRARDVTVTADERMRAHQVTGTLGAGLVVGTGASAGLAFSYANVGAGIVGASDVQASRDIMVDAGTGQVDGQDTALELLTIAGSAGLGPAFGAAVAVAILKNTVTVGLEGDLHATRHMAARAQEGMNLSVRGIGAQASVLASAGAVIAFAERGSTTTTRLLDNAQVNAGGNMTLEARTAGSTRAVGQAASGGFFGSGNAAVVTAFDNASTTVSVEGGDLDAAGNLMLSAVTLPRLYAETLSATLSAGLSMGTSVAIARTRSSTALEVDGDAGLAGDTVDLIARVEHGDGESDWNTVEAKAQGAVGGQAAINAAVADVSHEASVSARVLQGASITAHDRLNVSAINNSRLHASSNGITVGELAVGAHIASAHSAGDTLAEFAGTAHLDGSADMLLRASSVTDNNATSVSGRGGIIAGAAALVKTADESTTEARLANQGVLFADELLVDARHVSRFSSQVNSVQAALVGMSGAWAENAMTTDVSARIAAGATVRGRSIDVLANTTVEKLKDDGRSVTAGSGGVVDASAAWSATTLSINTVVDVGSGADLRVIGDWREPEHLVLEASNRLHMRDEVKLDAGGAIAVALAESVIKAPRLDATVKVGKDAVLQSPGDIVLAAHTQADVEAAVNAKTYGAAGAARGNSEVDFEVAQQVLVADGADLEALGSLRLLAGRDAVDASSSFDLTARTDLWNNTAFPVNTSPRAHVALDQDNNVIVEAGATLGAVADAWLMADAGTRRLYGKGTGKDLYREAAEGMGNFFGGLVGGGEMSFAIEDGSSESHARNVVRVDGDVLTGIRNHQVLELGFNPDSDDLIKELEKSDGVSYRVVEGSLSQQIQDRLDHLYESLANYAGSQVEEAAFRGEIAILEMRLVELAESVGADVTYIDGRPNVSVNFPIKMIEVDPIIAQSGNIHVTADALVGSGNLAAPGDARIDVINHSPGFLEIAGLEIPAREGGQLRFNNSVVGGSSAGEINQSINAMNNGSMGSAGFASVVTAANSPTPEIRVENTYEPAVLDDGSKPLPPDIFIRGDVLNLRGHTEISNTSGSVYVEGDIRAYSTAISSGRDFVLAYEDGFRHLGGDPRMGGGTGSHTIAGNNIIASARYLNINGLMQSGVPEWDVVIEQDQIDLYAWIHRLTGRGTPVGKHQIVDTNAATGTIGWSYDFTSNQVVLSPVEVAGGYMELTGHILNTGGGELKAMDGYGKINVDNRTGHELLTQALDAGSGVQGRIRLNDSAFSDDDTLRSTLYVRDNGEINVYQGLYSELREHGDYLVATSAGRSTTYSPKAGTDFIWLEGRTSENRERIITYNDTAIGFIPSGSGTTHSHSSWETDSTPIDGAEYVGDSHINSGRDAYEAGEWQKWTEEVNTESKELINRRNWTTCEAHFIVCLEKRQWQQEDYRWGQKIVDRYAVRGDFDIDIGFVGFDQGEVNITSAGIVTMADSIQNVSGDVNISGLQIERRGESAIINGNTITLDAVNGIGTRRDVRISADQTLNATTSTGGIAIEAVQGDLDAGTVAAVAGDVRLTAQGHIRTGEAGLISGDAISLTARNGSVGSVDQVVRIDTADTDYGLFTAKGGQGVHVREIDGSLRVVQVDAGVMDVSLHVDDGDLIDANTQQRRDERRLAELQGLWDEMGLTGDAAANALEQEKASQKNAGQSRYQRYWDLRGLVGDGEGNFSAQAYDTEYQASLSATQEQHLRDGLGWEDARIAEYRDSLTAEYHTLHGEFGALGDFDASFEYQLTAAELANLEQGSVWNPDQLMYSVSSGLLDSGTGGSGVIESPNVIAGNVTLSANNVGRTLAEDVVIDFTGGFAALTEEQRVALGTAERGDVVVDPDNDLRVSVIQRDAFILDTSGDVTVTAGQDIFLGGRQNLNLYDVSGGAVRLSAEGDITTVRPGETVVSGQDVILEAPTGSIGSVESPVQTSITGVLTARGAGVMNLHHVGQLTVDQIYGRTGVNLTVTDDLFTMRDAGSSLRGGWVNADVGGQVGTSERIVHIELGADAGDLFSLTSGGEAYLGAEQGAMAQPGNLRLGSMDVGGHLQLTDVLNLAYLDAVLVDGGLDATVGNWRMADDSSLTVAQTLSANVAGDMELHNVTVNGIGENAAAVSAGSISGVSGAAHHLKVAGDTTLEATSTIGDSGERLRLDVAGLDVMSYQGDIALQFIDGVDHGSVTALEGAVLLGGSGDTTLQTIYGRDGVTVQRLDGLLTVDSLTADEAISLDAQNATLNQLASSQGDITAAVDQQLDVDTITGAGAVDLTADAILLGDVTTVENLSIDAGSLSVDEATVGGALTSTTAGSQVLGTVDAGETISLTTEQSDSTLQFALLDGGSSLTLKAAGDVVGTTLATDASFDADVSGKLDVQTLTADGGVLIDAGSLLLDEATAGGVFTALTTGSQVLGTVDAGETISLTTKQPDSTLQFTLLDGGSSLILKAAGDVVGTTVATGASFDADVSGKLDVQTLTADGGVLIDAGSLLLDEATAGGAFTALTADSQVLGTVDAEETISLTTEQSDSTLQFTLLDGGSTLILRAAGNVDGGAAHFTDAMDLIVDGSATVGTLETGARFDADIGGLLEVERLTAIQGVELEVGDHAAVTTLDTDAGVVADVTGDLDVETLTAADAVHMTVGGNASVTTLETLKSLTTTIAGELGVETLTAGQTVNLSVGGNAAITALSTGAGFGADVTGQLDVQTLTAIEDVLIDAGSLIVGDAVIGGALNANTVGSQRLGTVQITGTTSLTTGQADSLLQFTEMKGASTLDLNAAGDVAGNSLAFGDSTHLVVHGSADIASLITDAGIDADITGELDTETLSAVEAVVLSVGGDATITTLTTASSLDADVTGGLDMETLEAGGAVSLIVGEDANVTSLKSGSTLNSDVAGHLITQSLSTTDAALIEAGALTLGEGLVLSTLSINTQGDQVLGQVESSEQMALTAGNGGTISFSDLRGGAGLEVHADGHIQGHAADGGAEPRPGVDRGVMHFAEAVELVGLDAMDLGLIRSEAGHIHADAGRVFSAQWMETPQADISIVAGGAVLGTVKAMGRILVDSTLDPDNTNPADRGTYGQRAGADIQFANLSSTGGDIHVFAGGNVSGSQAVAHGGVIVAGRNLTLERVETGGSQIMKAAGEFRFHDLVAGGSILIDTDALVKGQTLSSDSLLALTAGGAVEMDRIETAGRSTMFSAGGMLLGSIDAGADVTLDALDDIHLDYVISAGRQRIQSDGHFQFRHLQSGESIHAGAVDGMTGEIAKAADELALVAGSRVSDGTLTPSNLTLEQAVGHTVRLFAGDRIGAAEQQPTQVDLISELELVGQRVEVVANQSGQSAMSLNVTGANQQLADNVWLRLNTQAKINTGRFHAKQVTVDTSARTISIADGIISQWLNLTTARTDLRVDNVDARLRQVDLQIYEPDTHFSMTLDDQRLRTDAYVSFFRPGWEVRTPQFGSGGEDVAGRSMDNELSRNPLSEMTNDRQVRSAFDDLAGASGGFEDLMAQAMTSVLSGSGLVRLPRMDANEQGNAETASDEEE